MKKSTLAAVLAGLALAVPALLQPSAARAADSPFLGKWALDVTNSTMMDPKPKSVQVNVTTHDAKHVVWTETAVTAKGTMSRFGRIKVSGPGHSVAAMRCAAL